MEKMILDIRELPDGVYAPEQDNEIINLRFGKRLSIMYCHDWAPKRIPVIKLHFSYEIQGRKVRSMCLEISMDEYESGDIDRLCTFCSNAFNLEFKADKDMVYFLADNMYDMGALIMALEFMTYSVCVGRFAVVDEEPNIDEALTKWRKKQKEIGEEVALYDAKERAEDEFIIDDDYIDEHHVRYSHDRKTLICASYEFNEIEYHVPDGVEEICGYSFFGAIHFLELFIPRSVICIGQGIFGNAGGRILIEDR